MCCARPWAPFPMVADYLEYGSTGSLRTASSSSPIGAIAALVWANTGGLSYFTFAHAAAFPVNQIGMAFFLALVAQDVADALVPGGALHSWRRWSVVLVAAVGGMVGSFVVFTAYVSAEHETVLAPAWPTAMAIDVAAGYYVLRTVCRRHCAAIPFFVLLAGATNLVALALQAGWRPFASGEPAALGLLVVAVALAAFLHRRGQRSIALYVAVCGPLSWVSLYLAGVNPMLALLPLVPFLPHEPRRGALFAQPDADDELHTAEHRWHDLTQVVLFFFGLVNAGVLWRGYGTGAWATLAGALVGRPLGILAAVGLALLLKLRLPRAMGWRELTVAACATTSGFTFALLFATSVLPPGAVLQQAKFGALLTVVGALATVGVARALRVGRYAVELGEVMAWHTR